jgi:hypothetical protein
MTNASPCPNDASGQHPLDFVNLNFKCNICSCDVTICSRCEMIQMVNSTQECNQCLFTLPSTLKDDDLVLINRKSNPKQYKLELYKEFLRLKRGLNGQRLSINHLLNESLRSEAGGADVLEQVGDVQHSKSKRVRRRGKTKIVEFGIDYSHWEQFLRLRTIILNLKNGKYVAEEKGADSLFSPTELKILKCLYRERDEHQQQIITIAEEHSMQLEYKLHFRFSSHLPLTAKYFDVLNKELEENLEQCQRHNQENLRLIKAEIDALKTETSTKLTTPDTMEICEFLKNNCAPLASKRYQEFQETKRIGDIEQKINLLKQLYYSLLQSKLIPKD